MTREEAIKIAEDRNKLGFEGDHYIEAEIKSLVEKFSITHIIETGTYKGRTTAKFAEMCRTLTLEINPEYFKEAKQNLQNNPNVLMYLGDSVKGLTEYLPSCTKESLLFFLDAHWNDYCPLLDELKLIAQNGLKPVIVIHDFYVPDRPELGYDSYKGQRFDLEWIKPSLEAIYGEGVFIQYNSKATGAMRGVIYITPSA